MRSTGALSTKDIATSAERFRAFASVCLWRVKYFRSVLGVFGGEVTSKSRSSNRQIRHQRRVSDVVARFASRRSATSLSRRQRKRKTSPPVSYCAPRDESFLPKVRRHSPLLTFGGARVIRLQRSFSSISVGVSRARNNDNIYLDVAIINSWDIEWHEHLIVSARISHGINVKKST